MSDAERGEALTNEFLGRALRCWMQKVEGGSIGEKTEGCDTQKLQIEKKFLLDVFLDTAYGAMALAFAKFHTEPQAKHFSEFLGSMFCFNEKVAKKLCEIVGIDPQTGEKYFDE